ncbi:MAG TPA: hypothetical protein VH113_12270 [Gemmatimonadales bacterium]|nr:hypothetical protein [Gemmatimonadales bacterium]
MTEACIPNIGPIQRRKRLWAGLVYLGVTIAALAIMMARQAPHGYRLLLFLPLWAAGAGLFQYLEKT